MNLPKATWLLVVSVLACFSSVLAQNFLNEYDGSLNIQLFHALNVDSPQLFTSRGNITVMSVNTGDFSVNQRDLEDEDRLLLKKLAEKNMFYRVKAVVVGTDGIRSTFLTASKACSLVQAQLNDQITITFDHTNAVVGINHKSIDAMGETCGTIRDSELEQMEEFNTMVSLKTIELAPIPDTASFIQKVEQERDQRERGETKDNRSFIAKYWMYIVPCVILLLISGVTNPDSGAAAPAAT
ncbi:unnamed protein product [Diamesa tonsa]